VVVLIGVKAPIVEIVCEDDERLLHILNDSIRSVPGVRSTETFLDLKLAKQTYPWGPDE
jgi:Lrp/AsnC family transcriptional regulator for asnA, asnC and gidA